MTKLLHYLPCTRMVNIKAEFNPPTMSAFLTARNCFIHGRNTLKEFNEASKCSVVHIL